MRHAAGEAAACRGGANIWVGVLSVGLLLPLVGCGGHATGTVVVGIVPGGQHQKGIYAPGVLTISEPSGHQLEKVKVRTGQKVRLELRVGSYMLKAQYLDEPCLGRAVVRANTTSSANVICQAK